MQGPLNVCGHFFSFTEPHFLFITLDFQKYLYLLTEIQFVRTSGPLCVNVVCQIIFMEQLPFNLDLNYCTFCFRFSMSAFVVFQFNLAFNKKKKPRQKKKNLEKVVIC